MRYRWQLLIVIINMTFIYTFEMKIHRHGYKDVEHIVTQFNQMLVLLIKIELLKASSVVNLAPRPLENMLTSTKATHKTVKGLILRLKPVVNNNYWKFSLVYQFSRNFRAKIDGKCSMINAEHTAGKFIIWWVRMCGKTCVIKHRSSNKS